MRLMITIDVEAHRVRDEISGERFDSLGDILRALKAADMKSTFFVDLCEVATWGIDFLRTTCVRILDDGHDLQLHAHPHHVTKDQSRWLLSEYTRSEQSEVLDYAVSRYIECVGARPKAFRAGGFGADLTTIDLLREHNIATDCSLMSKSRGCLIPELHPGAPTRLEGLLEIPLTPVTILGSRKRALRTMAIDFNWLPLWQLKRVLRRLRGAPAVTLLMHSSSLCARLGARRYVYRPSHLKKLKALLQYIREEGWEVTTVEGLAKNPPKVTSPVFFHESNFALQYVNLLYRSLIGASFRPKFAVFLIANVLGLLGVAIAIALALR